MVVDDPERLDLEVVGLPPRRLAQQELERSVGDLEVVAAVLEGLQVSSTLDDASESSSRPSSSALSANVDRPAISDTTKRVPLPTASGGDVLVRVAAAGDRTGVQSRLVGEGCAAHIGLLRVGREVHELGDVVRDRRDPLETLRGDGADVELQRQVGDRSGEVGVAGPLAVPVHASLDVGRTGPDPGDRVGHGTAGVVVEVHADLALEVGHHAGHDALDVVGEGATVGVAQHEGLGPGFLRGAQDHAG